MKKYQKSFSTAVLGSFGWLTGLLVLTKGTSMMMNHVFTAFAGALIIGAVLAVGYPWIWQDSKLNRFGKIAVSALTNIGGGSMLIALTIPPMFERILPWLPAMLLLSCALHFIAACFTVETSSR